MKFPRILNLGSYKNQHNQNKTVEKSWPQILAILSGCLAAVTSGILYAWPSPFLVRITKDKENYDISEEKAAHFTTLNMLAMLLAPLLVPVINIIGRKSATLICLIPYTAALLLAAFAKQLWTFYLSRICYGLGDALLYCAFPTYIGEISTPDVRGVWGTAFTCGFFVGNAIVNIIGTYCSIKLSSFIALIPPLTCLLTFSFMPESPYFYIMKGKYVEAKESLRWLRGKEDIEKTFDDIKEAVERQIRESGTWKDLFVDKTNRKALLAGFSLRFGQQFTGFFTFTSYTQFIFEKSGTSLDSRSSSMIYSSLVALLFIASSYFSDMLGRRKGYIISLCLASIVVLTEGIYFYIDTKEPQIDLQAVRWFPVVGMFLFVLAASCGVGIIPTLMSIELFSASIKSKGIAALTFTYAGGTFAANNIFYYLNASFGLYAPFFLFGCCNIISAIVTYFIVPETKGKTLEEIQEVLKNI